MPFLCRYFLAPDSAHGEAFVQDLVMSVVKLKNSTKRPQEYLKEMAPMPNFRLEVCCQFLVTHSEQ